jgi:hypothetical protein
MFVAVSIYASFFILSLYALFALWQMGLPLCVNSQPTIPPSVNTIVAISKPAITSLEGVVDQIAERLGLHIPKRALAATAYQLADDLMRFLQDQGATPSRSLSSPVARIARMMGAQMTRFPGEMIQEQYCSNFSTRMARVIPQLREAGGQFRYDDEYYTSPSSFMIGNTVQSIAVELREIAHTLTTSTN